MANTTNYNWETPDDTDLVKDGAAAIRTLGSAIDTTVFNNAAAAIAKSIIDAKADLITATAADTPARLAVGTDGQVLTADSTTATGLKWAGVSAWSPNLTLLNAGGTALTGAGTITVNVSSFDSYLIHIDAASSANASAFMRLRINADSGNNYNYVNVGLSGTSVKADTPAAATSIYNLGRMGNNAGNALYGFATILGGKTTGLKPISSVAYGDGTTTNESYATNGYYYGTAAITSISLLASTGNFDAGTIYIYGG